MKEYISGPLPPAMSCLISKSEFLENFDAASTCLKCLVFFLSHLSFAFLLFLMLSGAVGILISSHIISHGSVFVLIQIAYVVCKGHVLCTTLSQGKYCYMDDTSFSLKILVNETYHLRSRTIFPFQPTLSSTHLHRLSAFRTSNIAFFVIFIFHPSKNFMIKLFPAYFPASIPVSIKLH